MRRNQHRALRGYGQMFRDEWGKLAGAQTRQKRKNWAYHNSMPP